MFYRDSNHYIASLFKNILNKFIEDKNLNIYMCVDHYIL